MGNRSYAFSLFKLPNYQIQTEPIPAMTRDDGDPGDPFTLC
jgi:hypothetical protein